MSTNICQPYFNVGRLWFNVGRLWLFFLSQSVRRTKGVHRRLQLFQAIDLHFTCLNELRNKGTEIKALKSSAEKAGLQEDHGRAGGFEAVAAIKPAAQETHD